ncbi:inositol monophosphatase family protein [Reichenbachiella versicolor]|uniref:inositol monophosphatase family protein n=1 Tax=Reichenbachiella versicolor TaxID=1821036 RepID=UPI000D6E13A2|nr:inositol monophosphatase family protein [Reichenbachiella versicolor]
MKLAEITNHVVDLAKDCGEFMKKERETFSSSNIEYKGKNDLVSYVDKETEKKIVARLKEILPEAGFITEEGTAGLDGEELQWIIDPLDGTTNYIHGLPCYSTSIALAKGKELLIGVVNDVAQGDCYHAFKGNGAFCNDQKIEVSPNPTLSKGLVATGFPYYEFKGMSNYLKIITHLMQNCHGLRRWGSAAIDLAYVACGKYDGYFEYNLNSYDVAAGALLVQEAGGTVTDFSGKDDFLFGREIVSGNSSQSEILEVIQEHWEF